MVRGPRVPTLVLTGAEKDVLEKLVRQRSASQVLAQRARIILACAEPGVTNTEVAQNLRTCRASIVTWRRRFLSRRLDGLVDRPRPGAPRLVKDEDVIKVILLSSEKPPGDAKRWSSRTMAKHAGLSQTTVSRIWRRFGYQRNDADASYPHCDLFLAGGLRSLVGLYIAPPFHAVIIAADAESTEPESGGPLPFLSFIDQIQRCKLENGKRSERLFARIEAHLGTHLQHLAPQPEKFVSFLESAERAVSANLHLHLICDNADCDRMRQMTDRLRERPRWRYHPASSTAAWFTLVEDWLLLLEYRKARADRLIEHAEVGSASDC